MARNTTVGNWLIRLIILVTVALNSQSDLLADLQSYVKAKDKSFSWKREMHDQQLGGTQDVLRLNSLTWKGFQWTHFLVIMRPLQCKYRDSVILFTIGGSNLKRQQTLSYSLMVPVLMEVAKRMGCAIALLSNVPNQPLFGRREAGLHRHTFEQYLQTEDETWISFYPMSKASVAAMDALQEFLNGSYGQKISKFVLLGGRMRGWSAWLTAAVDDRVSGIVPIAADILNLPAQVESYLAVKPTFSRGIQCMSDLNLSEYYKTASGKRLLSLIDPYSYREKLTIPKVIVLGTKDEYWTVDAAAHYFSRLPGEKYLQYVPGANHNLNQSAHHAIATFAESLLAGKRGPRFRWAVTREGKAARLRIDVNDRPEKVELVLAVDRTRDFRNVTWDESVLSADEDGSFVCDVPLPEEGFTAFFGRLTYKSSSNDRYYPLCTTMEVPGERVAKKKKAP